MTTREKAFAAKRLVGDETFSDAVAEILAKLNNQLLNAKTPEEREQKFQEYSGLNRVWSSLKVQAAEVEGLR